jgi:hypothetical protein
MFGKVVVAFVLLTITVTQAKVSHKVKCGTTKGDFVIALHHDWSPLGVERYRISREGSFIKAVTCAGLSNL